MGRKFDIPDFYRSPIVSTLKNARRLGDQRKRDLSPTVLDVGRIRFKLARHFGFCFGVENAIEIAYRALAENPGRRVFLLSEMIHNPHVNEDLIRRGIRFLQTTAGNVLIPFEDLGPDDIVIVPAFGTTVETFNELNARGIRTEKYNATCPFVEKVWKRSEQLGAQGYTVIIHGKHSHEETRATFSHAAQGAPGVVIRDMAEAQLLASYLRGERDLGRFLDDFKNRYSAGFDPFTHLNRVGVVNQTTMLATETQAIADVLKQAMVARFGPENIKEHFADTRDTLCYATSENQDAVKALLAAVGDLALVVGGYNSSNTSHLVEILETSIPTFYIKDAAEILSADVVRHLDLHSMTVRETRGWFPAHKERVEVLLTAGASCPDSLVDAVVARVVEIFGESEKLEPAVQDAIDRLRGQMENPSSLTVLS